MKKSIFWIPFGALLVVLVVLAASARQPVRAEGMGTVVAWGCQGTGNYGQCDVPAGLIDVTAVSAGQYHSLALKSDGTVVAWGCAGYAGVGQCDVPAGLSGVIAISAAPYHNLALKSDGTVVAWGCGVAQRDYGQCAVPRDLTGVVAIGAGYFHSLALKSDGTLVTWGCLNGGDWGQCVIPDGVNGAVVTISVGGAHTNVLLNDGTVVHWGCGSGQPIDPSCTLPANLGAVTALATGGMHSMDLHPDGSVTDWGCPAFTMPYGQCVPPVGLNAVAIAAAFYNSLAIQSDGTVVGWGCETGTGHTSNFGQCDPPPGLGGVIAISGGLYHSLALVSGNYQTPTPTITATFIDTPTPTSTAAFTDTPTPTFTPIPGCLAACLRSSAISMTGVPNGASSQVTVQDENSAPVANARVSVTWTFPNGSTSSTRKYTDISGLVSFSASGGSGLYTITVDNITLTGFTFDPSNSILSASLDTSVPTPTPTPSGCLTACLRSTAINMTSAPTGVSAQVTVQDENGTPIAGAKVTATWTLPDGSSSSKRQQTDASGNTTFNITGGAGLYTITVNNITLTGATFDPLNSILSASITK